MDAVRRLKDGVLTPGKAFSILADEEEEEGEGHDLVAAAGDDDEEEEVEDAAAAANDADEAAALGVPPTLPQTTTRPRELRFVPSQSSVCMRRTPLVVREIQPCSF